MSKRRHNGGRSMSMVVACQRQFASTVMAIGVEGGRGGKRGRGTEKWRGGEEKKEEKEKKKKRRKKEDLVTTFTDDQNTSVIIRRYLSTIVRQQLFIDLWSLIITVRFRDLSLKFIDNHFVGRFFIFDNPLVNSSY